MDWLEAISSRGMDSCRRGWDGDGEVVGGGDDVVVGDIYIYLSIYLYWKEISMP